MLGLRKGIGIRLGNMGSLGDTDRTLILDLDDDYTGIHFIVQQPHVYILWVFLYIYWGEGRG